MTPDPDPVHASRADDEAAVRALYAQLMEGWNRGDAAAFAEPFSADGHLVAFDGMHFQGRENIIAFHQPLFDRWLKGTQLVGEVETVHFLSPNAAVLHARGSTVMPRRTRPSPERDSLQTLVAVREAGNWRLFAFQNTRIRPMSEATRNTLLWLFTDWLWRVFGSRK